MSTAELNPAEAESPWPLMGRHRKAFVRVVARSTLALVAIAAAALLGEVLVRIALDNAFLSPRIYANGDADIPYRLLPGMDIRVRQFGRTVAVGTDPAGHRRTVGAPSVAPVTLHVVGDSQVFGWGLSDEETVASRLQALLGSGVAVINHGVPGYGPSDYLAVVKTIPVEDFVLVVHTEENDSADAYRIFRDTSAGCGFLLSAPEDAGPIRCWLMSQRLVQMGFVSWSNFQHRYMMTPLGFSTYSQVAADVLNFRIEQSYAREHARRGSRLVFSIVPWKGRYSTDWRERYTPPPKPGVATIPTPFADDFSMLSNFASHRDALSLFLGDDSHISPAGAGHVARVLATVLSRRLTDPARPVYPEHP